MSNGTLPLVKPFAQVLMNIEQSPTTAWVYLPTDREWSLDSPAAVLETEEVPPEMKDEPDAGVPQFAKDNKLKQALPVSTVQDIVRNARAQSLTCDADALFRAFMYYYEHDAFLDL